MEFEPLRDRSALAAFLERTAAVQVYALADLDDFFWPETTWFGAREDGRLCAVALLLGKLSIPVLYAVCPPHDPATRQLLAWLRPQLPDRYFVNLGLGLEDLFLPDHDFEDHAVHRRYALRDPERARAVDVSSVERLDARASAELDAFYARDAYLDEERGGRFFEPYMLERWPFAGIREGGRLVCVGGTHVLSDRYRVAAIGNVATRPDCRGRGLARQVTAWLCRELTLRADHLGMNVREDNTAAVRCYEGLGFEPVICYREGIFTRRSGS